MVVGELAHERELVIIGGGPGGYHAAIRAAQLGKSVTLIEKDQLGGICLNKGCIPSKVIAHGAERFAAAKQDEQLGIKLSGLEFEIEKLHTYKKQVVKQLREGVEALCKMNKVELVKGSAFFLSNDKIGVENGDSYEVFRFTEAIIATGGTPIIPEGLPDGETRILNPWTIADLAEVPEHLVILGGDYIALETAMSFNTFGSRVSIVLTEHDFPFDTSINKELTRVLKKSGITVLKGYFFERAVVTDETISVVAAGKNGRKDVTGTHLFYSLGTRPQLESIGIDRLGIEQTDEGFIAVDHAGRTTVANIFAIGDVTEGPNLAVKAIKQGKTAAEVIGGRKSENDFTFIPYISRTQPPIAYAGLTEKQAESLGYAVGVGEFSFSANGFATVIGKKEGLAKLVFDKETELLLGVHLIGSGAVELISQGIQALELAAREEDVKFPSYPHPSINEALLEAVEAFKGEAIHSFPKRKKEKV